MSAILKVILVSANRQFAFLHINLKRELTILIMMFSVLSPDKFWSILKYLLL